MISDEITDGIEDYNNIVNRCEKLGLKTHLAHGWLRIDSHKFSCFNMAYHFLNGYEAALVKAPTAPTPTEESPRDKAIGQNGNTGEHYLAPLEYWKPEESKDSRHYPPMEGGEESTVLALVNGDYKIYCEYGHFIVYRMDKQVVNADGLEIIKPVKIKISKVLSEVLQAAVEDFSSRN